MPARVRLVATAGPMVGRGHIARVLSLAEARWTPGTVIELELVEGTLTDGDHGRARAVGLRAVPGGTSVAADGVAIVDVPQPGSVAARFDARQLAVFDDRDGFAGPAALIIQPSQAVWSGPGDAATVLAGYDYVPIPAAVRRLRSARPTLTSREGRRRVLVCFGGSDPARVTAHVVPALARALDADIDVVVGASYTGPIDDWPVRPRRDPPDLVERLAAADIAVLGAGTMKFEAACLARPMILLAVADDQLAVAPAFAATGAARYLGDGRTINPAALAEAVVDLLADPAARGEMGETAGRVVDGDGGDRIAAAIERFGQPAERS